MNRTTVDTVNPRIMARATIFLNDVFQQKFAATIRDSY